MSVENDHEKKHEQKEPPLAQPSEGPLKNEPTPERAREEKTKQKEEACREGA